MNDIIITRILNWLIAITMTDAALINIIATHGDPVIADILSGFLLYSTTLLSLIVIINGKRGRTIYYVLFVLLLIAFYQKRIVQAVPELYNAFLVHAIGGMIIGYAITDYKSLIKKAGVIAILFSIFLFTEPLSYSLLGYNQSGGYILANFAIWLLIFYFYRKNKKLLILIIPFSLLITLLSSRGCGVSIIAAWAMLTVYDLKIRNKNKGEVIGWTLVAGVLGIFLFLVATNYIFENRIITEADSSFAGRYIYGGADDSSGRTEIWSLMFDFIKRNVNLGVGFGNDRQLIQVALGYHSVHNIILEMILNFGLYMGVALIVLYSRLIYKSFSKNKDRNYILLIVGLICMHIIRLFVSGSYIDSSFELFIMAGMAARSIDMYSYKKVKICS